MSENTSLVSKGHLDGVVSQFVTGPELDKKQDRLNWYRESGNGGELDPYKADTAANEVVLRAGPDTAGAIIYEKAKISLKRDNGEVSIASNYGHDAHAPLNLFKTETDSYGVEKILIGDSYNGTSVFIQGPMYDKDGKEINGGASGGGSKWISDAVVQGESVLKLGSDAAGNWVHSIYMMGPIINPSAWMAIEFTRKGIVLQDIYTSNPDKLALGVASDDTLLHSYVVTDDSKNLSIGAEKGAAVRIVVRDSSGSQKVAEINYDNIDKLINLLNS